MKREEQIKQLQDELDSVLLNQKEIEGRDDSYISQLTFSIGTKLVDVLTKEIDKLKQLDAEEKFKKDVKSKAALRASIYSIPDFNDVEITHYLTRNNEVKVLEEPMSVKELYEEDHTAQFLGYNDSSDRYVFSCISDFKTTDGHPIILLLFGKKKEKQLKHPHMKNIVDLSFLGTGKTIINSPSNYRANWEVYDEVQIIGEGREYGIVVKATKSTKHPDSFTIFFCKRV